MQERKHLRYQTHNYALAGNYFITTCVKNYQCCFGYIRDNAVILNQYGEIAAHYLEWLQEYYPFVKIGAQIVMPNHVHAIIQIHAPAGKSAPRNLPQLMSAYKSRVSTMIHSMGYREFSWHRSFHDHIIRKQRDYDKITDYIKNNPKFWINDRYCRQIAATTSR